MTMLEDIVFIENDRLGITFGEDFDSYASLNGSAAAYARTLSGEGVAPGHRVGLVLSNGRPSVVALLAIWHASATVLSIPPAWIRGRSTKTADLLDAFDCQHIISDAPVPSFRGLAHALPSADSRTSRSSHDLAIPHVALIQFTSGTTASPRAVLVTKAALASHVLEIARALELDSRTDRAVSWLPLSHDMGLIGFLMTAMAARVPLRLLSPVAFLRSPRNWLELCAADRATITGAPNFAYELVSRPAVSAALEGSLAALRVCLSGGERVSYDTCRRFLASYEIFGLAPQSLMPVYGMAENILAVAFPRLGSSLEGYDGVASSGIPLAGVEVRITNADGAGRGNVEVRSPWACKQVGLEYPAGGPSTEWRPSGDRGVLVDGKLFVLGRSDGAAVIRGRNICPEEVEAAALGSAERTPPYRAVAVSNEEGDAFDVALAFRGRVTTREQDIAIASARRDIALRLGISVRRVVAIQQRSLPTTSSGKLRRRACRYLFDPVDGETE